MPVTTIKQLLAAAHAAGEAIAQVPAQHAQIAAQAAPAPPAAAPQQGGSRAK